MSRPSMRLLSLSTYSRTTAYLRSSNSALMSFSCSRTFSAPSSFVRTSIIVVLRGLVAVVALLLVLDERGLEIFLSTSAATSRRLRRVELFGSKARLGLPTAARSFSMSSRIGCAASMREHQRVDEVVLAGFGGAAFDHHDGVLRARDDQIDVRPRPAARRSGKTTNSPFDARDAHAGDRAVPRDVRDVERGARAGEGEDVGRVDLVVAEDGRDDLRVVLVALGEERTAAGDP